MFIEDDAGNVILDEVVTTLPNGFMDLWLPREKTLYISISYEGKTAEQEISTFKDDNTCITTMRLL